MLLSICTLLYHWQRNVNANEAQYGKRSGVTWAMFTAIIRKSTFFFFFSAKRVPHMLIVFKITTEHYVVLKTHLHATPRMQMLVQRWE